MTNTCSRDVFSDTAIRWLINSFINDIDINKKQYDVVVGQLKYKHIFSTKVVPRLERGTRLVATDHEGPCNNCYHYGPWRSAGSEFGFCMNHLGWHYWDKEKCWLTFKKYKESSRLSYHFESYEHYKIECEIKFRREEKEFADRDWGSW